VNTFSPAGPASKLPFATRLVCAWVEAANQTGKSPSAKIAALVFTTFSLSPQVSDNYSTSPLLPVLSEKQVYFGRLGRPMGVDS
jgi:hypothetical protein